MVWCKAGFYLKKFSKLWQLKASFTCLTFADGSTKNYPPIDVDHALAALGALGKLHPRSECSNGKHYTLTVLATRHSQERFFMVTFLWCPGFQKNYNREGYFALLVDAKKFLRLSRRKRCLCETSALFTQLFGWCMCCHRCTHVLALWRNFAVRKKSHSSEVEYYEEESASHRVPSASATLSCVSMSNYLMRKGLLSARASQCSLCACKFDHSENGNLWMYRLIFSEAWWCWPMFGIRKTSRHLILSLFLFD